MRNAALSHQGKPLPKTYAKLSQLLPPRPIHSDTELARVTAMIDRLAGFKLNRDQEDYLDALSTFVAAYERTRFSASSEKHSPVKILRLLLEEHNMSASDLGRLLGNRSVGPAILKGERRLSKAHIQTLADHFGLDSTALLQAPARSGRPYPVKQKRLRGRRSSRSARYDERARQAGERLIALGGCDPNASAGRRRRSEP